MCRTANPEKKRKVSQKEKGAPDPKGHEGEIWHKPFSYRTKAGVTIKVEGHCERKPGSEPKAKVAKPSKSEVPKAKGKSHRARKVKEAAGDVTAPSTPEAEADA